MFTWLFFKSMSEEFTIGDIFAKELCRSLSDFLLFQRTDFYLLYRKVNPFQHISNASEVFF